MEANKRYKVQSSDGKRFIIYAPSRSEAILKARKQTTAKTIYIIN